MNDRKLYYEYVNSPLGEMEICADDLGLLSLSFIEMKDKIVIKNPVEPNPVTTLTKIQLEKYFENGNQTFDVPLSLSGTDFQLRVWNELTQIKYGTTLSYLWLARRLGDEKCIRAAAAANGKNPIAIIVPCHRVIGTNGKLVGYAGELWRKKWLLEHESASKQGSLF